MRLGSFVIGVGAVFAAIVAACAEGTETVPSGDGGGGAGASGAGGASGGAGGSGGDGDLCAMDCGAITTPACLVSVCNEGQFTGVVGQCVVVNADDGTACEDGAFCTANDTCVAGMCTAGPANDCGMEPGQCQIVTCNEASQGCSFGPGMNGTFCTPSDQCLVNATCVNGSCSGGTPKDCFFAPVPNECYVAVCNPMNGNCEPQIDPNANGNPCVDQSDLCTVNKVCDNGSCVGGVPMDCSGLTQGCFNGVCDTMTGNCVQQAVPPGGMCAEATDDCNDGICDMLGNCNPVPTNEGGLCDDFDGCTSGTTCTMGQCVGGSVIVNCADNDGCCPMGCVQATDNDCIRPNLMLCGFSGKSPLDFTPPMMSFNLQQSCTPDNLTQAFFVTRNAPIASINAATLQSYLQNGGIVLTEYSITDDVFNIAFGTNVQAFNVYGSCYDCFPRVVQFSPADQFWIDNAWMPDPLQPGCGYSVDGFPGITPISGWAANAVAVAYRDLGSGRFWLTDFDWQDGEIYPCMAETENLMGYMMTHK